MVILILIVLVLAVAILIVNVLVVAILIANVAIKRSHAGRASAERIIMIIIIINTLK